LTRRGTLADDTSVHDRIRRTLDEHRRAAERLAAMDPAPVAEAAALIVAALRSGGKVLACGNGGSAADAQHFAAELVGRYRTERVPLPGIALTTDTSILTALGNDYGFEEIFARQVRGLARPGDVVIGLSTSGASRNVLAALEAARSMGAKTVAMAGAAGGPILQHADVAIQVPSSETPRIQEGHAALIHLFCELVDEAWSADVPR
jgi:D-sedoheptulose 7-phosphate isomerase